MRATIEAENDDYTYEITLTDDGLDNPNFVEMLIKQKGEDYFESWVVPVKDLYDLVNLFDNRRP
jgi:hypothetical protein